MVTQSDKNIQDIKVALHVNIIGKSLNQNWLNNTNYRLLLSDLHFFLLYTLRGHGLVIRQLSTGVHQLQ